MKPHPVEKARTLHAIALVEAFKGVLVLAASFGLLGLLHHDVRSVAREIVRHFGLNPAAHYPTILLHYADILENANLRSIVLLAVGYSIVRMIEAYGLWNDLAWGEWLGALSGAIYIPFEIRHFMLKPSIVGAGIFIINVAIVGYLAVRLYRRQPSGLNALPGTK